MPKTSIDYNNTYFYKIVCKDVNVTEIYVGHTTEFSKRKSEHKKQCNHPNLNRHNLKVYQYIREHGGWDNFDMVLIDKIPCQCKLEACKIERQFIEDLHATLNAYIPTRTKHEYYQDTRDHTIQRVKNYYEQNKEKIDEWRNTRFDCECGGSYFNHNKARHDRTLKHKAYMMSFTD